MKPEDLVLVTGATGFIGGRLVEKLVLEHGMRVRILAPHFGALRPRGAIQGGAMRRRSRRSALIGPRMQG